MNGSQHSLGIDGILGTRASIMLDVVFLAMFLVVPMMGWSVWLVRARGQYALHKRIQMTLATVLLLAIVLFEIDMRFLTDWRARAEPSSFYPGWVLASLGIHLCAAIPTTLLWLVAIVLGLNRFDNPPRPNTHSPLHRILGWLGVVGMSLTALTGWIFYWLAFAC